MVSTLIFLVIAGLVTFQTIPREAEPDITIPTIYVSVNHFGISPEDAERLLVRPMEQELNSIEGIKEMRSSSFEGGGNIILEFNPDVDIDEALSDVRANVDTAKSKLPQDAEEPVVREINLSLFPILVVTLSGDIPERSLLATATSLQQKLRALPRVLKADIVGKRKQQVDVIIDPLKIQSYGLTAQDVLTTLSRSNILVASGVLDAGQGNFAIKVPGLIETAQEFQNLPIKVDRNAAVTLGDIAEIRQGFEDPKGFARINGQRALAIEISKRTGENIVATIDDVKRLVQQEQTRMPSNINVIYTQNKATRIKDMLSELQNSVILSVLLVIGITIIALGVRASLLVCVSIPGAFFAGIFILGLLGVTLNVVVLFSLILTVGMLVDGVIVVTEYADRMMHLGHDRKQAYALASKRMGTPVIVSTMTTLTAFMPLLFWPGIVGEFMVYLPLTLIVVLTASLAMALLFVPTIGAYVGAPGALDAQSLSTLQAGESGKFVNMSPWATKYLQIMTMCLRHPARVVMLAVGALFLTQFLYASFGKGVEFFPKVEPDTAVLQVHARGNLSVYEKDAIMQSIEQSILDMHGVESFYTRTGKSGGGQDKPEDIIGSVFISFAHWQSRPKASVILEEVERRLEKHRGLFVEITKPKAGPPVGKDIQIRISALNPEELQRSADKIIERLRKNPHVVNIDEGLSIPGIEWRMDVNRIEATRANADITTIGQAVQLITRGIKITEYRPDDSFDEIDIRIRFPEKNRNLDELNRLFLKTQQGDVPVSNFTERVPHQKVGIIRRTDSVRSVTIKADVASGVLADDIVQPLKKTLASMTFPPSVTVQFKGEDEEQKKAAAFLQKAFGVALFSIMIILIAQFNSFFSTFLILTTIIMSTIGVFLGLLVANLAFSIVMSGIGIIALAGIVVNNNIILIDTWMKVRQHCKDERDAILRTGIQRLRPVLLTTITTIFGLLPVMLGINIDFIERDISQGAPSSQFWQQLATSLVFGLAFATILTLVVTPSALMLFAQWQGYSRQERYDAIRNTAQNIAQQAQKTYDKAQTAEKKARPHILSFIGKVRAWLKKRKTTTKAHQKNRRITYKQADNPRTPSPKKESA
ncbi:MAG: efflux RND transporter permease subunit [Alphaproteobacteria bacterium GM7ARS4]|nr:efflux RND transporter permease subunit [Alphaproteobacteria bacterium GM7ARS4]